MSTFLFIFFLICCVVFIYYRYLFFYLCEQVKYDFFFDPLSITIYMKLLKVQLNISVVIFIYTTVSLF